LPKIGRDLCYESLEVAWYGPAILAVVLFSQASFYVFRPGGLAIAHAGANKSIDATHICLSSRSTTCPVCATKRLVKRPWRGASSTGTSSVIGSSVLRSRSFGRSRGRFRARRISFRFAAESPSSWASIGALSGVRDSDMEGTCSSACTRFTCATFRRLKRIAGTVSLSCTSDMVVGCGWRVRAIVSVWSAIDIDK
jgi:hypothetical protein